MLLPGRISAAGQTLTIPGIAGRVKGVEGDSITAKRLLRSCAECTSRVGACARGRVPRRNGSLREDVRVHIRRALLLSGAFAQRTQVRDSPGERRIGILQRMQRGI